MANNQGQPGTILGGNADTCATELMTLQQVADYFRVCTRTVRNMIASKQLEATRVGRQFRISRRAVQMYLVNGRKG
jgi:excisionase family DNA binding protein